MVILLATSSRCVVWYRLREYGVLIRCVVHPSILVIQFNFVAEVWVVQNQMEALPQSSRPGMLSTHPTLLTSLLAWWPFSMASQYYQSWSPSTFQWWSCRAGQLFEIRLVNFKSISSWFLGGDVPQPRIWDVWWNRELTLVQEYQDALCALQILFCSARLPLIFVQERQGTVWVCQVHTFLHSWNCQA